MPSSRNPFYNCTSPRCPWCDWRCSCANRAAVLWGVTGLQHRSSFRCSSSLLTCGIKTVLFCLNKPLAVLGWFGEGWRGMQRVDSLKKTLMLGGIRGRRRRGRQRMRWLDGHLTRWTWVWVNSGRWWWTGRPGALRFMGSQRVRHDWATELDWTEEVPEWGCPQQLLESPIEFSSFHAQALPGKLGSSVPPWNL